MIPVKVCGITSNGDAQLVVDAAVSAVGFIFYEASPRFIKPERAREISDNLPSDIRKVGVFVNASLDSIHTIAGKVGVDLVQLHGNETPEFCDRVKIPVIKAFRIQESFSTEEFNGYNVHAFLLDTYSHGTFGGTGETFNWELVKNLNISTPIIVSGGLNPQNIMQCITHTTPQAVDVNSGIESWPGKKDERKINQLFEVLRNTGDFPNIFDVNEMS